METIGTMETGRIRELILEYEERRAASEDLEAEAKEARALRDEAEAAVIGAILATAEQTGIDDLSVNVEGRKYSVKVKDYFSITKANQDEAFRLLRDLGHGDIITERVDPRTLTSEMSAVSEEYRTENPDGAGGFPDEYGPLLSLMSTYSKPSLTRVKAK